MVVSRVGSRNNRILGFTRSMTVAGVSTPACRHSARRRQPAVRKNDPLFAPHGCFHRRVESVSSEARQGAPALRCYTTRPSDSGHYRARIPVKTFHCTACQALVFFENTQCLSCGHALAFVNDKMTMLSLEPQQNRSWVPIENSVTGGQAYRLCINNIEHGVCNWAIPADSPDSLCKACSLTQIIPDLSVPGNREAWLKLETAKRRLLFDLFSLELPFEAKREPTAKGLEFRFLSDVLTVNGDRSRILTGHDNGVITINVAEANDAYREAERLRHREPYRTLLGHFRHEIGHYYWDLLIEGADVRQAFRQLFGDERADYQAALKIHYEQGAPANWTDNYISAYASTHPWEDWAESWAHVLHMVDALETAHAVGLSVKPTRGDEPALAIPGRPSPARIGDFDQLVSEWNALTYVLNNLTRGLGLPDAYPFVLCAPVVEKLRFICSTITSSRSGSQTLKPAQVAA